MRQGSVKTSIAYLLLALFLTVKMAGLHLLIHDGDKKTVGDVVLFCDKVSADCLFSRPPPMA